jgi:uncharacterized damage-inducible protein DinB
MLMKMNESTLSRLRSQLSVLPLILGDAGTDALRRRPAPGKWSVHENLAHLARYHEVFIGRLKRMLVEEAPNVGRYQAEEDPDWWQWPERSPEDVLSRLKALRVDLVRLVESLEDSQFGRVGVHPLLGPMPIPLWLEFFLLHEGHHLYTIMRFLPKKPG